MITNGIDNHSLKYYDITLLSLFYWISSAILDKFPNTCNILYKKENASKKHFHFYTVYIVYDQIIAFHGMLFLPFLYFSYLMPSVSQKPSWLYENTVSMQPQPVICRNNLPLLPQAF